MIDFSNKVAIVTGGASGIGQAAALGFARGGAKVVVVDRDVTGGKATVELLQDAGTEAMFVETDVTQSAQVAHFVEKTLARFGSIDCFYNNAGVDGKWGPTAESDEEEFDHVVKVNLKGVYLGLRHVLPVMLRQKSGAVVNTASIGGLMGVPGMSAYIASKHGVIGLTQSAAGEVAHAGVRVNAVCPGLIDTPMFRLAMSRRRSSENDAVEQTSGVTVNTPMGRVGTPEEMANVALFLCSDLASYVTGSHYVAAGGRLATAGAVYTPR